MSSPTSDGDTQEPPDPAAFDRYRHVVERMLRMTADAPSSSYSQMAHMLLHEADEVGRASQTSPPEGPAQGNPERPGNPDRPERPELSERPESPGHP